MLDSHRAAKRAADDIMAYGRLSRCLPSRSLRNGGTRCWCKNRGHVASRIRRIADIKLRATRHPSKLALVHLSAGRNGRRNRSQVMRDLGLEMQRPARQELACVDLLASQTAHQLRIAYHTTRNSRQTIRQRGNPQPRGNDSGQHRQRRDPCHLVHLRPDGGSQTCSRSRG